MFNVVDRLAADIEAAWASVGHARDEFTAIAAAALAEPVPLDFASLAEGILGSRGPLPRQRRLDDGFGQPSVTLHHDERFVIEALCWLDGSPAIHQHAFTGAFQLVTGRSVHTCYTFDEWRRFDDRVLVGDLRLVRSEVLEPGMTTAIREGSAFIHAAFHLHAPGMTIVARTHESDSPEYTYLPPGLAFDPAARTPDLHKRLQLLDALGRCDSEQHLRSVAAVVAHGDLYAGVQAVLRAGRHQIDDDGYETLVELLVRCHGPDAEPCRPAILEARRRDRLMLLRASRTDPEDRFLLACLLNFTTRATVLAALRRQHGSEPAARRALGARATSLLGLDRRAEPLVSAAVAAMLDDVTPASFPDAARPLLERDPTLDPDELRAFYADLQAHPVLAPLRS